MPAPNRPPRSMRPEASRLRAAPRGALGFDPAVDGDLDDGAMSDTVMLRDMDADLGQREGVTKDADVPIGGKSRSNREERRDWEAIACYLPPRAVALLEHIEVPFLRLDALELAERKILVGRPRGSMDPALYRELWARAWRRRKLWALKALRLAIDTVLRDAYVKKLYTHEVACRVPMRKAVGDIVVNDPDRRRPSFGLPSFPEATPPHIVAIAVQQWESRRERLRLPRIAPQAWDITAGSGTVHDVLRLEGGRVVSTDLTASNEHVTTLDCRDLGRCMAHGALSPLGGMIRLDPAAVVAHPDLVFFDPPSRGRPSEQDVYDGPFKSGDLAVLDRAQWIATVCNVVLVAAGRLASSGLVSLVVRKGVRESQRVEADGALDEDVINVLTATGCFKVVARHRVRWGKRRNQASLAQSRCPMTHLLLAWRP